MGTANGHTEREGDVGRQGGFQMEEPSAHSGVRPQTLAGLSPPSPRGSLRLAFEGLLFPRLRGSQSVVLWPAASDPLRSLSNKQSLRPHPETYQIRMSGVRAKDSAF